jgi:hypothetical protein
MMKFKVSPSVRAAAVPTGTGFGAFDGLKRHCIKFQAVGGKLRCKKFKTGRGQPKCDRRLTDGGRSPGLVRPGRCPGATFRSRPSRRRAR